MNYNSTTTTATSTTTTTTTGQNSGVSKTETFSGDRNIELATAKNPRAESNGSNNGINNSAINLSNRQMEISELREKISDINKQMFLFVELAPKGPSNPKLEKTLEQLMNQMAQYTRQIYGIEEPTEECEKLPAQDPLSKEDRVNKVGLSGAISVTATTTSTSTSSVALSTKDTMERAQFEKQKRELEEMSRRLHQQNEEIKKREKQVEERERKLEKSERSLALKEKAIEVQARERVYTQPKMQTQLAHEYATSISVYDELSERGRAMIERMAQNITYVDHPITRRVRESKIAEEELGHQLETNLAIDHNSMTIISSNQGSHAYSFSNPVRSIDRIIDELKMLYIELGAEDEETIESFSDDFINGLREELIVIMMHIILEPKYVVRAKSDDSYISAEKERNFSLRCKNTLSEICNDVKLELRRKKDGDYGDYFEPLDSDYVHNQKAVSDFLKLTEIAINELREFIQPESSTKL